MASPLNDAEITRIMSDTASQLLTIIQARMNSRIQAQNALAEAPIDKASDEIKKMREIEAGKLRAVIQEQQDLISIVKVLYPNAKG